MDDINEFPLVCLDDDPRELEMIAAQIDPNLLLGARMDDIGYDKKFFDINWEQGLYS